MRIDYHHPKKQEFAESNNSPSTTLFVGGIKSRTVKDLYDIFREHSPRDARVSACRLLSPPGHINAQIHSFFFRLKPYLYSHE